MCSSPFDCALFGNGLLKLEDSRRHGGGGVCGGGAVCREIYGFVIRAEEDASLVSLKREENKAG